MISKTCSKCRTIKFLTDFYLLKEKRGYAYKSWCKACLLAHMRKKKEAKIRLDKRRRDSKYQDYQQMYYRTHRAEFARYRKEFITRHPDYYRKRYARKKAEKEAAQAALTEGDIHD